MRWRNLYREAELYKAAVRIYTKPLFSWRKVLFASTDNRDLYDFARSGLHNLANIHRALAQEAFSFRPAVALHRNFRGKRRDLYIYPWEERLVDLLLYRILSARLHACFSPNCYAYRLRGFGLDRCQRSIAKLLRTTETPLFVVKRDIANYFPSVDHPLLLAQLAELIEPDDYLFRLLRERVRFPYQEEGRTLRAEQGIAFGTPMACFFANMYLTPLDRKLDGLHGMRYFRYADDYRRRQIRHGQIAAPFFVWKSYQTQKSSREAAARLRPQTAGTAAFSPSSEAVANQASQEELVGESRHLSTGLIEVDMSEDISTFL